MSIRIVHRIATLALLAACLTAPAVARAAPHEPPGEAAAKPAPRDTSRFLPNWLSLHGSAGLGWLASPEWMRKFYQAGQSYDAGLETRPGRTFRLRLNGEYQALPAVTDAQYSYVYGVTVDGTPLRDTVVVQATGNGWIGSARLEAQWALAPELWVLGGFGRGYLSTGLQTQSDAYQTLDFQFPGSSEWLWVATAGASYEFNAFGPRLSLEVRSNYMLHEQDRLQTWSIRLGWGGH